MLVGCSDRMAAHGRESTRFVEGPVVTDGSRAEPHAPLRPLQAVKTHELQLCTSDQRVSGVGSPSRPAPEPRWSSAVLQDAELIAALDLEARWFRTRHPA